MIIRYINPEHLAWHLHDPWCRCFECWDFLEGGW